MKDLAMALAMCVNLDWSDIEEQSASKEAACSGVDKIIVDKIIFGCQSARKFSAFACKLNHSHVTSTYSAFFPISTPYKAVLDTSYCFSTTTTPL